MSETSRQQLSEELLASVDQWLPAGTISDGCRIGFAVAAIAVAAPTKEEFMHHPIVVKGLQMNADTLPLAVRNGMEWRP